MTGPVSWSMPSGAESSSKLTSVAVTGGGINAAGAPRVSAARIRTPVVKLRVSIVNSFQRDFGAGRGAGAGVSNDRSYGTAKNCALPGKLSEPGPGRSASPSRDRLPVGGMQKLLTSTPA